MTLLCDSCGNTAFHVRGGSMDRVENGWTVSRLVCRECGECYRPSGPPEQSAFFYREV